MLRSAWITPHACAGAPSSGSALAALAQAQADPAPWRGMTRVGGVRLPGEIAGQLALDEVVLHAWDLARGTGQPYQQDPATPEACLAAMTGRCPPDDLDAARTSSSRRYRCPTLPRWLTGSWPTAAAIPAGPGRDRPPGATLAP